MRRATLQPLPGSAGGYLALALLTLPGLLAFYALLGFAEADYDWQLFSDRYFYAILGFSLQQAALSALVSVALALPVARAVFSLPALWGRQLFLSLCLLCFVLPTLVLVTGLVALLGGSGWLTPWLMESWNLYGLHGIVLAHVFLNMPFAIRALFLQLESIPDTSWRLAAQLKLSAWQRWQIVEWPVLRGRMLILSGFIFVLCFNSFAVVLALGGGPQATTLEVAIYQALKYDFNMAEALTLAGVQLVITGGLFIGLNRFSSGAWLSVDLVSRRFRPAMPSWSRYGYTACYVFVWGILLLPLLALLPGLWGAGAAFFLDIAVWKAAWVTLGLGGACALLAVVLAYLVLLPVRLARLRQHTRRQAVWDWLSIQALVTPAMVLSVGLYIFFLRRIDLERWGMVLVLILNTLVVLPFVVQQLRPRLLLFDDQYARLVASLRLSAWQRLKIEWRWAAQVLHSAFALALVLVMGDVAIFSIFGVQDWMTLPWLIYSYASTYRLAEASWAALLLLLMCAVVIFWLERERSDVAS